MLFNSLEFMIFFPIVVLIFLIIPKKLRSIWLLIASYYFYMSWNPRYTILILFSTAVTYLSGILLNEYKTAGTRKLIVAGSLLLNLALLFIFKYANFALDTLRTLLNLFGISFTDRRLDLLLPVGISFYTFQAMGYTIDVYRHKVKPEYNFLNYALFVSFFPQLVAGPIERTGSLLKQIQNIKELKLYNLNRIREGILLMLWGLFQKLIIADRASLIVNNIYDSYKTVGTFELIIASLLFAFQIYCDFAGYTNIARGAAKVMGFSLIENFRQPYLAVSITDYWRRWHISMTSWFRDYLYIPLGGNRKGILRKYINILIVFFISGLWHGASWHFVAWGLVNGIFQIIEDIISRLNNKFFKIKYRDNLIMHCFKTGITFTMINITFVFFSSKNIHMALNILYRIFTVAPSFDLLSLGFDKADGIIMALSIIILIIIDIIHEKGISVTDFIVKRTILVRGIIYAGIIWSIILFGIYGTGYDTGQFIYFQF
ncbi:MAG: MBOAT family protein [Lachnospiraceae bacterium]|nr:MBOAT family protein [Lachnospiraceae bacterium]